MTLGRLGYKIDKVDPQAESIPADYNHLLFLPRVYPGIAMFISRTW